MTSTPWFVGRRLALPAVLVVFGTVNAGCVPNGFDADAVVERGRDLGVRSAPLPPARLAALLADAAEDVGKQVNQPGRRGEGMPATPFIYSKSDSLVVYEVWSGNMLVTARVGVITAGISGTASASSVRFKCSGLGGNPDQHRQELSTLADLIWSRVIAQVTTWP